MIKRVVHIILSGCLSVLLLFGTTAKEFIHLFAGHEDTVHLPHEGLAFESEHHHCTFLSFTLSPFIDNPAQQFFAIQVTEFTLYNSFIHERVIPGTIRGTNARGPPVFYS